jgi:hypothetical protein
VRRARYNGRMAKFGEKSLCATCGQPIHFLGRYWAHQASSPKHPATPLTLTADGEAFVEVYRDDAEWERGKAEVAHLQGQEAFRALIERAKRIVAERRAAAGGAS